MTTATLSPKSAKVKFRLAGGAQPLILLPVQVNGDGPFKFILDTGAGTSLLSSDLAKKLIGAGDHAAAALSPGLRHAG